MRASLPATPSDCEEEERKVLHSKRLCFIDNGEFCIMRPTVALAATLSRNILPQKVNCV